MLEIGFCDELKHKFVKTNIFRDGDLDKIVL